MHCLNNAEFRQTPVRNLFIDQRLWNDSDYLAALRKAGARNSAHQTNRGATIHQPNMTVGEQLSKHCCGGSIFVELAGTRPTEYAHGPNHVASHMHDEGHRRPSIDAHTRTRAHQRYIVSRRRSPLNSSRYRVVHP